MPGARTLRAARQAVDPDHGERSPVDANATRRQKGSTLRRRAGQRGSMHRHRSGPMPSVAPALRRAVRYASSRGAGVARLEEEGLGHEGEPQGNPDGRVGGAAVKREDRRPQVDAELADSARGVADRITLRRGEGRGGLLLGRDDLLDGLLGDLLRLLRSHHLNGGRDGGARDGAHGGRGGRDEAAHGRGQRNHKKSTKSHSNFTPKNVVGR